jgi:hypothetical protein
MWIFTAAPRAPRHGDAGSSGTADGDGPGLQLPPPSGIRSDGIVVATLASTAACVDGPDISAQRLLDSWKGEDPGRRMVAEVIASAFASGLSWKGSLGGKEVYCSHQD